jgi:hypothetical protein
VITGSDIRYPVHSGYRYYRGTSSKTARLAGKRLLRRIELNVRVAALRATEPETGEEGDDDKRRETMIMSGILKCQVRGTKPGGRSA